MKWAAELIAGFDNASIDKVQDGAYLLNPDYEVNKEEPVFITAEDLEVSTDEIPGYEVANKGSLTVALDITITDDLKKEGNAREFVNKIQNIRKESNFELTDRIIVTVLQNEIVQSSLNQYKDYICAEILADSLVFLPVLNNGTEIEVNDSILIINVVKKEE
jgi:isoleucyl-tRNA synthetase